MEELSDLLDGLPDSAADVELPADRKREDVEAGKDSIAEEMMVVHDRHMAEFSEVEAVREMFCALNAMALALDVGFEIKRSGALDDGTGTVEIEFDGTEGVSLVDAHPQDIDL